MNVKDQTDTKNDIRRIVLSLVGTTIQIFRTLHISYDSNSYMYVFMRRKTFNCLILITSFVTVPDSGRYAWYKTRLYSARMRHSRARMAPLTSTRRTHTWAPCWVSFVRPLCFDPSMIYESDLDSGEIACHREARFLPYLWSFPTPFTLSVARSRYKAQPQCIDTG